jgi:hypothetical protein
VRKDKNFIPSSATLLRHIQKKVAVSSQERFGGHLNSLKIKGKVEGDPAYKAFSQSSIRVRTLHHASWRA